MLVSLRNPKRLVEVATPITVRRLLQQLDIVAESVLVIRNGELVTPEQQLDDRDDVEVRPVISGGAN